MTEVQDTTDRKLKWMRRTATILAVVWAASWTLVILAFVVLVVDLSAGPSTSRHEVLGWLPFGFWLLVALLVLPPWASAAIPWRWEAIGGVALVIEALLQFSPLILPMVYIGLSRPTMGLIALSMGFLVLPLVAGMLFLASWRKSRTSAGVRDTSDRAAERLRCMGRGLTVIGAYGWTHFVASTAVFLGVFWAPYALGYFGVEYPFGEVMTWLGLIAVLCYLIAWVSAAIPWRWEGFGGVVLVVEGLLLFAVAVLVEVLGRPLRLMDLVTVSVVFLSGTLPLLVAGNLFLASWRRSRASESRQDSAQERR